MCSPGVFSGVPACARSDWRGIGLLYAYLSRMGFVRNTAYRWAHMVNNLASLIFGFIYISLWQAVTNRAAPIQPYTGEVITQFVVLAQVFAWFSVFLPAGLGIHLSVRTGSIALEMARPIPFFGMVLAREAGNLVYQALFRAIPIAGIFALTVGFPAPGSLTHLLLTLPSLLLAGYMGMTLTYIVGLSSFWTLEIKWAHWAYHTAVTMLSGGWIPVDLLPGPLAQIGPYLPFASQLWHPIRIYLGLAGLDSLLVQSLWALAMTLGCQWLTRRALRRIVIQGG